MHHKLGHKHVGQACILRFVPLSFVRIRNSNKAITIKYVFIIYNNTQTGSRTNKDEGSVRSKVEGNETISQGQAQAQAQEKAKPRAKPNQDKPRQAKTRQDKTSQDKTRRAKT